MGARGAICYARAMLPLLACLSAQAANWELEHQLAASWFPKGLRYAVRAENRLPLWNRPESVLFEETYLGAGAAVELTPAYARVGPSVTFAPIAVFDVTVEALWSGYFGTFSGVTDFDTADADYSEAAFTRPEVEARRRAGHGWRFGASPTLKARVGKVIVALPQDFRHFRMQIPAGATGAYWYEPEYDALLAWNDTLMVNQALAFWSFRDATDADPRRLWLGLNFTHQYVFGTEERQVKLGPMLVWKPGRGPVVPTIVVFAQAYLAARTHPTFPPYLAAAAIW